jgi:hypothetical protein
MSDNQTVEMRFTEDLHEFIEFIKEHGVSATPADSVNGRTKGVRATIAGREVLMYLRLATMIDSAESLGEKTKKLLVTPTGQLIRDFSRAP